RRPPSTLSPYTTLFRSPDEDQGYMFLNLQLPSASSLQRTEATARAIEEVLAKTPGIESSATVVGFSLLSLTRASYSAFFFVTLRSEEHTSELQSLAYLV